jgi:hypothetical protein
MGVPSERWWCGLLNKVVAVAIGCGDQGEFAVIFDETGFGKRYLIAC